MSKKAPPPNFLYRVKVYSNEHPPWSEFCVASAPINGMPHLAYLWSMLEKRREGGEFAIKVFPMGLVLSWNCPNPLN